MISLPSKRNVRKWLPGLVLGVCLLAVGIFAGGRLAGKATEHVIYRRITFQRGTIYSARFSPDSHSILYGAMWNGEPLQLYTTVGDSSLARPLGFMNAHLLALSSSNELALVVNGKPNRRTFTNGVLARAPLAGGTPREILDGVVYADWSPQRDLAVVQDRTERAVWSFPLAKCCIRPRVRSVTYDFLQMEPTLRSWTTLPGGMIVVRFAWPI